MNGTENQGRADRICQREKVGTKFAYGARGEVLSHKRLQELIVENPNKYTSRYIERTKRNLNQICVDSPGMSRWKAFLRGIGWG